MPWSEVKPGRFEREFESLENFYRAIAAAGAPLQREHFQVHCIVKIAPMPSKKELQVAWKTLRNHFPLLAGLDEEDKYAYQVPDAQALQAWTEETCHYFSADHIMTVDELLRRPKPSSLIQIYAVEKTGELVIRSSHWRMDGIGCMNLTNALLELLASPVPESSLSWSPADTLPKLTPGIDEVVHASKEGNPERQKNAQKLMDIVTQNPATMAFKTQPNQLPGSTGRINLTLSEGETLQILKACKARSISVSIGIHAALILAGQRLDEVQAKTADGRYVYTDQITVSLRKYLPPPFNSGRVPLTIYHTGVPMTVDVLEEHKARSQEVERLASSSLAFSHVAFQVSRTYRQDHSNMFDYLVQWVDTIVAFYSAPPSPEGPPPPALPDLSSLGILDEHLKTTYDGKERIELIDWAVLVEILAKHIMCHCWTWKKRLNLQAVYNEANYERNFVGRLQGEWKAIILRELV